MGRQRQRRVKTAEESLKPGVWSVWGRRLRDPGNGWARAAAEGEGQGWEKPWAGGRGIPGEGGEGRGTGCQGPADGSLPQPRAASWGAGPEAWVSPPPPTPPAIHSAIWLSEPYAFPHPASPQLPPAPPLAPRRHAPSLFSCRGTAPSPSPSGPLASPPPHLPGSLRPRAQAAQLLSDP